VRATVLARHVMHPLTIDVQGRMVVSTGGGCPRRYSNSFIIRGSYEEYAATLSASANIHTLSWRHSGGISIPSLAR
jgi:hypothetical protein